MVVPKFSNLTGALGKLIWGLAAAALIELSVGKVSLQFDCFARQKTHTDVDRGLNRSSTAGLVLLRQSGPDVRTGHGIVTERWRLDGTLGTLEHTVKAGSRSGAGEKKSLEEHGEVGDVEGGIDYVER